MFYTILANRNCFILFWPITFVTVCYFADHSQFVQLQVHHPYTIFTSLRP